MSEGGRFPWKIQTIFTKGPVADYSNLRNPLPPPPEGKKWHQDEKTKEWKILSVGPEPTKESKKDANDILGLDGSTTNRGDVEDEWELLSETNEGEHTSSSVAKVGSVRSLSSASSVPFKIQRTHSSSTIDSQDNGTLGPSGKGVLGVDYVEHVILPSDTLQGICLAYKINPTRLRQANHFSGNSLILAPKKLVIPLSKKALRTGFIRVQDTDAKEYKLHAFLAEFPDLSSTEAKAYLELADWILKDAVQSAKQDNEWEKEIDDSEALRSGQIRIRMNTNDGIFTQGAGLRSSSSKDEGNSNPSQKPKAASPEEIPSIATKTVKAKDVYEAASQHDHFGVELKSLTQPLLDDKDPRPSV